jgi:glutamate-1-semialdehyde 2,1-aminomutase
VATLTAATPEVYAGIDKRSLELSGAVSAALGQAGVDHSIQRAGNLFSVAFGTSANGVHNYEDAQGQEAYRYAPFFHSMLDSGVYLPPSVFEAWFLSAAHDDAAMDRIYAALPAAAKAAAAASPGA